VVLAEVYRRFAVTEARGRSSLYETLALGVAGDAAVLGWLMSLPPAKRQPNLLFAAYRHVHRIPADWADFRAGLLADPDGVAAVMRARSTQTNEAARCAVLLPVLASLPGPLALIEVGASAGLCLLPDLYGYRYGERVIPAAAADAPVFSCAVSGLVPVPAAVPKVVWRAGLDLNPIDAADAEQTAWLESLVWPEQTERLDRLRAALRIAAGCGLRLERGDLLGDGLERLCADAPAGATLVVFHTAVLAYVADRSARMAFGDRVMGLCDYWLSNEAPGVVAERDGGEGRFLLSVNGEAVAWTDPHGAAIDWISA
jgi:hypothetical protein